MLNESLMPNMQQSHYSLFMKKNITHVATLSSHKTAANVVTSTASPGWSQSNNVEQQTYVL